MKKWEESQIATLEAGNKFDPIQVIRSLLLQLAAVGKDSRKSGPIADELGKADCGLRTGDDVCGSHRFKSMDLAASLSSRPQSMYLLQEESQIIFSRVLRRKT